MNFSTSKAKSFLSITPALMLVLAGRPKPCPAQNNQLSGGEQIRFHLVPPPGNSPVKLIKIVLGDTPVQMESRTTVNGSWVRGIKVTLQNVSLKTIGEAGIILSYPETGTGAPDSPILTTSSHVGRYPDTAFRQRDGSVKALPEQITQPDPIALGPGESVTLSIGEHADLDLDAARRIAKRLTQVSVAFGPVYFTDGSVWKSGTYLTPGAPPNIWTPALSIDFIRR